MFTRRQLLGTIAIPVLGSLGTASRAAAPSPFTLNLSWLVDALSVGELMALTTGAFERNGLSVKIVPGGPSSNTVQEVVGGSADAAVAYAPQLMQARANGIPIRTFGAALQRAPLAFWSLGTANIKSIRDWRGKRIGAAPTVLPQITALLAGQGMTPKDVTVVQTGDVAALLQGQVDVIGAWELSVGQIAPIINHPSGYNVQRLWDSGVRFQSNYYIAREDRLNKDPDRYVAFLKSCDAGWAYAADHPDESIRTMIDKFASSLDFAQQRRSLEVALKGYVYGEQTTKNGWGYIDEASLQATLDQHFKLGIVSKQLAVKDIYDPRVFALARTTKR